jgi:hypothetical protein
MINFFFKKNLVGEKSRYWMTSNKNIVLFTYDLKHLFRHSYVARYKIYNMIYNVYE